MKKLLLACLLWVWLIPAAMAQQQVSGKVTDYSNGEALPGVNILLKGTTSGTISDIDGNYSLAVPSSDAVLIFSFIGYETFEVTVGSQRTINTQLMPDLTTLGEVVVVGYGTMRKSDLTSAHVSIGTDQIGKTINTTLDQAIQGRAAGVYVTQNTGQPGGGISVNIRGVNTISGSNEPLYVIDGVQIAPGTVEYGEYASRNPLAGLNPADIESMEILQGPSATAIYGSRATNGVILITTKRGKAGETQISYGYQYSLQDKPEALAVMDLPQYAEMTNHYHQIAGGDSPTAFADPSILGPGTNWQEELFKTAPLQKHQLSFSGGSENTQFYFSGEYFDQEGIALGSGFERFSIRANINNQTRDWLKFGANLSYNETNEKLAATYQNVILNAIRLAPYIPVRNPDGSWGGADETNAASLQFTPANPIALAELIQNDLTRRQFLGSFNASVEPVKGLTISSTFTTNIESSRGDNFIPTYQLGSVPNTQASLTSRSSSSLYWNWNQLIQYNRTFGKHDVTIMASHEAQESNYKSLAGTRLGFVSNDLPDLNIGDPQGQSTTGGSGDWAMESFLGRLVYSFNNKYIVQGAIRSDGSVNFGPDNRWGTFPSVSAAWRISEEPFFSDFEFINELKLRFETGVTGNQGSSAGLYGPLASVTTPWGAGFRLDQYGNQDIKWEETVTNNIGFNISVLNNRIQLEGDFYIKNTDNLLLSNPLPWYMGTSGEGAIRPPTVNIGALENKGYAFTLNTINIDNSDFFWKSNFNVSGFKTKVKEFYSDAAVINRTSWFIESGSADWTQRSAVGQAPWLFFGYVEEGLFQSIEEIENSALPTDSQGEEISIGVNSVYVGDIKYKDINKDGVIDERDQTYIGNPWPKMTFGFSNDFSYKNFDLSILLTGSYGNDIYNVVRFTNSQPGNINLGRNMLDFAFDYARIGMDEENNPYLLNPETNVPRITNSTANGNNERFTDKYVEDGSYIRLKNIQLSYNFPESFLARQNVVKGARVSMSVQNIATFTKYKGYDPEVGAYVGRDVDSNNQAIGVDYGRYPITPVYTFSVGIDF